MRPEAGLRLGLIGMGVGGVLMVEGEALKTCAEFGGQNVSEKNIATERIEKAQSGQSMEFIDKNKVRLSCQIEKTSGKRLICEFPALRDSK